MHLQEAAWGTLVEEVKSSNFDVARDWMSNSAAVYNQLTPDRTISVGSVSVLVCCVLCRWDCLVIEDNAKRLDVAPLV